MATFRMLGHKAARQAGRQGDESRAGGRAGSAVGGWGLFGQMEKVATVIAI